MVDEDGEFFQTAMTLYSLYKIEKTASSMYKAYRAGGIGALLQAAVVGTISYGAGEIMGGISGDIIPLGFTGDLAVGAFRGGTSGALGSYMTGGNVGGSALEGASMGALSMGMSHLRYRESLEFDTIIDDYWRSRVSSFMNRNLNRMRKYAKNITSAVQSQENFNSFLDEAYEYSILEEHDLGYKEFLGKGVGHSNGKILKRLWIETAYRPDIFRAYPKLAQLMANAGTGGYFDELTGNIFISPLSSINFSGLLGHELSHAVPYHLFGKAFEEEIHVLLKYENELYLPKY